IESPPQPTRVGARRRAWGTSPRDADIQELSTLPYRVDPRSVGDVANRPVRESVSEASRERRQVGRFKHHLSTDSWRWWVLLLADPRAVGLDYPSFQQPTRFVERHKPAGAIDSRWIIVIRHCDPCAIDHG